VIGEQLVVVVVLVVVLRATAYFLWV